MNPFLYQNSCCDENFCFRDEELEHLEQMISNHLNVLLYSKRKVGKTSLIKVFFADKIDKKHYIPIYIDLFDINNAIDFIKVFYKQIAFNMPCNYKSVLKELKELFNRVTFSATIKDDGDIEFIPTLNSYNFEELMSDIYRGLEKLSENYGKKVVIAFDEFQQIMPIKDTKIAFILHEFMEKYPEVNYIFTGLKRHLLTDLFSKKKSPLYDTVKQMEIKAIPLEQFYAFVDKKFEGRLDLEQFEYLYAKTDGETKLIQEFCYHLYYKGEQNINQKITKEDIDEVCQQLFESKSGYFKMLLDRLSIPKKVALKAIIITDGIELYTKETLFKLQMTKSSLNTAIRNLYKDEIIDKEDNRYYITNRCFELWCRKKFL
ncbi:AAA family ATPase [Candidatus Marinarcus aquaticus]|uniref:ATPase domain-containing protein n=1 Tax=Candidatus Marinarcus aquaticus TaxID=2044504 RepID=A0A4Q0XVR2_9BACT|nr:ATP-binding protein [Candidatus Marinarcus aquaticus]RXJ60329.1 hypothetical protein CRV04_04830 [Candidatus Marinarcus aquaticus]